MKKLLALLIVALLAVPVMAQGHDKQNRHAGQGAARKACKAERTENPTAFQQKYANKNGKRALKRCARQRVRAARQACRTERKADRDAFRKKYANENGKRAFRRCVRQKAGA